jgi:transposase
MRTMDWAKTPQCRGQLVMFPTRLDDAIGPDHTVRLLDEILSRIDWRCWEAAYDLTRGQPPIHPRVLAGVLLYGLLTRIRSSRTLEEALTVRIDFMWLVEGRTIDHTTLSEFRRKNTQGLRDLFVQIGLMETLAFDGTRIRANNRRSGTRTPEEFRKMKAELAARFAELEAKTAAADAQDEEVFGHQSASPLNQELAEVQQRLKQVDAALAELDRMEQTAQAIPKRLPLTDPQSRVTPNKDGGFAPNYTPLATVDVDSGLIVSADVIPHTDEDKHLISAIEDVRETFSVDAPPEILADGMMATGENLAACDARKIVLYSPLTNGDAENPALRDDLTQPVAAEDRDRLPTKIIKSKGNQSQQLVKQAFVYDDANDCYWCPQGKRLPFVHTTSEMRNGRRRIRYRYKADAADCAACPLRELCLQKNSRRRQVGHEQHESHLVKQRTLMKTDEAQEKYSRRCSVGERPFAVIKQQFGARQFLTRGLERVKQEWLWLTTAFNLKQLFGLIRSGVDPPGPQIERN